ncbi:radical SAM protein [Streptomyces sp. NBC_01462]|uniref:radical SAM protein n=1 Tax=Streptomyces sp. NBC_01462 TaxID=2903876 RepID=UPI002E3755FC|nr:radical SAM protein [Streptomyces sp. NBC_01462]
MDLVLNEPLKSWLQVTQSCNLKCRQCYGDCAAEPRSQEMRRAEYAALIREMAESGVIEVFVEGGEPLNRPDALSLLAELTPHVMTRLRTNATLLTPEVAAELKGIGIGEVYVDVLGATADTHDWHVQVPGSFDRTVQGVRNAQAAGLPVSLLIIMTRRNVHELQGVLDLAAELGVRRVGVLRLYPLGRARTQWKELALRLPDQMTALDALQAPDSVHLMTSWHPKDGNCCWQNAGVDATGRSVGCAYLRDYTDYGNVREVSWLSTWNDPVYVHNRSGHVDGGCESCEETQGSSGGCRSTAFAFTGRWDTPDPFCTTTNGGIDVSQLPDDLEDRRVSPAVPATSRLL